MRNDISLITLDKLKKTTHEAHRLLKEISEESRYNQCAAIFYKRFPVTAITNEQKRIKEKMEKLNLDYEKKRRQLIEALLDYNHMPGCVHNSCWIKFKSNGEIHLFYGGKNHGHIIFSTDYTRKYVPALWLAPGQKGFRATIFSN